jgi:LPXTG-motif cell wall-anchored protein
MNWIALAALLISISAEARVFKNSYVSFEVPDNWNCMQEGVAWTCTPSTPIEAREAVIVLAAKVAGPEDNLVNFHTYLGQPKKLATKVGTPMPSQVMYAQERTLAGTKWIQAQHLGSEIQQFYTLYLATVKESLAILISLSAEKSKYPKYNAVFDRAIKTLKITANNQLLFPKNKLNPTTDVIGIAAGQPGGADDMLPLPVAKKKSNFTFLLLLAGLVIAGAAVFMSKKKKKNSKPK